MNGQKLQLYFLFALLGAAFIILFFIVGAYLLLVQLTKNYFIKKYGYE